MDFELADWQRAASDAFADYLVREVAPIVGAHERERRLPPRELVRAMSGYGLLGGLLPEALGGQGLDHVTYGTLLAQLAGTWASLRSMISTSNLVLSIIAERGSAEQRERFLPGLIRGDTLALKEKEYVEAARASGSSSWRQITRHILPNALSSIIVAGAFIVPGAIISEAVLTYLGIGLRPDVSLDSPFPTSWGQMIQAGQTAYRIQPWLLIAPSLAVALITLSFTFVGDGLRDALDPRDQL